MCAPRTSSPTAIGRALNGPLAPGAPAGRIGAGGARLSLTAAVHGACISFEAVGCFGAGDIGAEVEGDLRTGRWPAADRFAPNGLN